MPTIKVHAGDFLKGDGYYSFGSLTLRTEKHRIIGETIDVKNLQSIEAATEESVKKLEEQ